MNFDGTPQTRHLADLQRISADRDAMRQPTTQEIKEYIEAQFKTAEQQLAEEQQEQVATAWVANTPEYDPNPRNGALMNEYLTARGLPRTVANLNKGFQHLVERGLITPIDVTREIVDRVRRENVNRRAAEVQKSTHRHTVQEMYEMPLDELRNLASRVKR